jgi:predicted alpha/beta hydrolase family esterase
MMAAEHAGHLNEHDGQGDLGKYQTKRLNPAWGMILLG